MYTANTMASSIEALGMSLPYDSSIPAEDPLKLDECRMAGQYMLELLKRDLKPRDIMTYKVRQGKGSLGRVTAAGGDYYCHKDQAWLTLRLCGAPAPAGL
jgi:dihydroxy-acid dehydratase